MGLNVILVGLASSTVLVRSCADCACFGGPAFCLESAHHTENYSDTPNCSRYLERAWQ